MDASRASSSMRHDKDKVGKLQCLVTKVFTDMNPNIADNIQLSKTMRLTAATASSIIQRKQ
eukprot:4685364-Amphidinium_carterae.2